VKLEFSILWFDDSEAYIKSLPVDDLKREIASWGFSPTIEFVTTPEKFLSRAPFRIFDLIVVDKNLQSSEDGQDFIERIREHSVYTEVIFYTNAEISELWDGIYEKRLEGIFVTSRDNVISKIVSVGKQSVSKVLDLENMRGIVMAEVGEIDRILGEILTLGLSKLSEAEQGKIFKSFSDAGIKNAENTQKKYANFIGGASVDELVEMSKESSFVLWINFNRLRANPALSAFMTGIGGYDTDVLKPRNILAHGKSIKEGDDGHLIIHRGQEYKFNDDVSLSLRQTILEYKNKFSSIVSEMKK